MSGCDVPFILFLCVVVTLNQLIGANDVPEFADTEPFDAFDFNLGHDTTTEAVLQPPKETTPLSSGGSNALCQTSGDLPTFVKYSRLQNKSVPKFVHVLDSLSECMRVCRTKREPLTGIEFDCQGFQLERSKDFSCEFFDSNSFTVTGLEKRDNRSSFFERICLQLPVDCVQNGYAFDGIRKKRLNADPIKQVIVENRKQCLDICLNNTMCKAVNFNGENGKCEILDKVNRHALEKLEDHESIDYFENMCIQGNIPNGSMTDLTGKQRCENNQRGDFVVSKNSEVSGLELRLGPLSIKNCMRGCVEAKDVFCRSFQYDPVSRECIVHEENSQNVVRSEVFDLYEPVCLDLEVDLPCPGDFVFEKVHQMNLVTEDVISILKNTTVEACLQACLFEEKCRSFTYNKAEQRCKILPLNRRNNQTRAIVENFIDFYELSCDREAVLKQHTLLESTVSLDTFSTQSSITTMSEARLTFPTETSSSSRPLTATAHACDMNESVLVEEGRTLRIEYRNLHHVNIKTLEECQELCHATQIPCQTFAFNQRSGDCLLSTTSIDKDHKFTVVTQPNPSYSLYAFLGRACDYNSSTTPSSPVSTTPSFRNVHEFTAVMTLAESNSLATGTPDPSDVDPFGESDPHVRSRVEVLDSEKVAKEPHHTVSNVHHNGADSTGFPSPPKAKTARFTTATVATTASSVPRRDKTIQKFSAEQVQVKAFCLEQGVNVTFSLGDKKYNGVVYAAERFAQCRVSVEAQPTFSLFIARPSINNYCNVLEEDGVLTAVLVMSNDMVVPYDVTTKDDFFYQITCDYNNGDQASVVRTGIVVGGPEPKSVMNSARKSEDKETKVVLRILKKHRPVSNVYIGEKLTAVVESDVDPSRLRVSNCNATRVGGREPRPNSVSLVRDGCSLMPQIMGNIVRGPHGLEAPFTAFRIDGSDQIDIVCSVTVCKEKCEEKESQCVQNRTKREAGDSTGTDKITVDQRIRVMVVDDVEDSPAGVLKTLWDVDPVRNAYCMHPTLWFGVIAMFLLNLTALAVSMSLLWRRPKGSSLLFDGKKQVYSNSKTLTAPI